MRNNSVELFRILTLGSGDFFKDISFSRALAAPLFSGAKQFVQFW